MENQIIQPVVLSISIAILAIFIGTKISISFSVSNLERTRNHVLYKLACKNNHLCIKEFLKLLEQEGNILFYEPGRSNKPLYITLWIFLMFSLITVFYPILSKHFEINELFVYSVYSSSAAVFIFFLFYDFKYYKQFFVLEKKYPIPSGFESEMITSVCVTNHANK